MSISHVQLVKQPDSRGTRDQQCNDCNNALSVQYHYWCLYLVFENLK